MLDSPAVGIGGGELLDQSRDLLGERTALRL